MTAVTWGCDRSRTSPWQPVFVYSIHTLFFGKLYHRAITAENMEKSQHTDFNEDTTNESDSVA